MDKYNRPIRYIPYGLAAVGVVVICRSAHIFNKFTSVQSIPPHYLSKNIKLRGTIRHVSDEGVLSIEHIPIASFSSKPSEPSDYLPVALAFIEANESTVCWLRNNISRSNVWFQILNLNDDKLNCILKTNSVFWRRSINETLIREGISTVSLHQDISLLQTQLHEKTLMRYIKAEHHASKKNVGMWKEPSRWEKIKNFFKYK